MVASPSQRTCGPHNRAVHHGPAPAGAGPYRVDVRLFDLTPEDLAELVSEIDMADMGDFSGRASQDLQLQVTVYLRGKPELAQQVLDAWLATFYVSSEFGEEDVMAAQRWYDTTLLGGQRLN